MPSIANLYDNTLNLLTELLCGEAICSRAQCSMINYTLTKMDHLICTQKINLIITSYFKNTNAHTNRNVTWRIVLEYTLLLKWW